MPLPTLKELLERFPDGFYGCCAANRSAMDYKIGGVEVARWRQPLLRVYSGRFGAMAAPPKLAENFGTFHDPDRFRLRIEHKAGAKYEVGLLVWGYIVGFKLRGSLSFALENFLFNFIFHIGPSNAQFLFQAGKGLSGLVSVRSGRGRRRQGVRCRTTLSSHWPAIRFRADPHCLLNPPSIFSNFDRRR